MNSTANTYTALADVPRLLMECDLKPLQGDRFQPTGFPDLGPARYVRPDGTAMLLIESTQSVANRMELACWSDAAQDLADRFRGLPYVKICNDRGAHLSNSLLEAHRINSEYIMKGAARITNWDGEKPNRTADTSFREEFATEIDYQRGVRVNWRQFHRALLKYDPNSLIHGCFLEEIGGRLRVTRALSGFIEASDIKVAESGGVKNNIVEPELKGGEGNVPYPRTEFVAGRIAAYFSLDLALLRGYALPEQANDLLITLALLKIRRFLSLGLRLRTACDLEPTNGGLRVARPGGFGIPDESDLLNECGSLIKACGDAGLFADPRVTSVLWKAPKTRDITVELPPGTRLTAIPQELKGKIQWKKEGGKKPPQLIFKEGLDSESAQKAKDLFPNDDAVARAIDETLHGQSLGAGKDGEGNS